MGRAIELCRHFQVPVMVCINKFDLNPDNTTIIEKMTQESGYPLVGRIPFDPLFTRAMVQGMPLPEFDGNGSACASLRQVWATIINSSAMQNQE